MIGTLVTLFLAGLITIVLIGVVLSVIGAVFSLTFGLASFLLLKVAPIVLLGWVVLKIFDRRSRGSISAADRAWLEGRK